MTGMKISKISFTNIRPVYHFFQLDEFDNQVELIPQVPSQLNKGMAEGTIDAGPVSSFEYGRNYKAYDVLPDLSISSHGPVGSIFLFTKRPLAELSEPHIALTDMSATSVNLLRIILQTFEGIHPVYTTMPSNLDVMMSQADGALLIGDDALLASWNNSRYYMYDLGEMWYRHTGMWMTYAVWAVRREAVQKQSALLSRVHHEFLRSKKQGLAELDEVIRQVKAEFGGTESFWKKYYAGHLSYDFTTEHKKGLEYYYACAANLGLLAEPAKVEVWDPNSAQSAV